MFKSCSRHKDGPLVKGLRHRLFTAVTRVRIPYGLYFMEDYPSRLKGTVLKTVRRVKACVGSNPTSSFTYYRGMEQLGSSSGS